jgi:inhibitor of KinA
MKLVPLGDQAILAYCDDEAAAARIAAAVRNENPVWLVDVVLAYASVAVFFDALQISFAAGVDWLNHLSVDAIPATSIGKPVVISCCYELGPDLHNVANMKGLSPVDVIRLHSSVEYTVYAIGFCPGFPYLGYLPDELAGVPRLPSPRVRVEPGSVGLTGRQTGIYPLPRPGGWPLIGRTPMKLVDLDNGFFAFSPGDRVRFRPITIEEFGEYDSHSAADEITWPAPLA